MKINRNGFTIVELIITMAIFGIIFTSIIGVFQGIRSLQRQAYLQDTATRAAQRQIEKLRNDTYGSLTPGQNIDFTSSLPAIMPSGSSGIVVVSQPSDDLRRVDVTVSYSVSGAQRSVVLSSLIGVIGITQ